MFWVVCCSYAKACKKQPGKYPIGSPGILFCFQPAASQLPTSTSGMRKQRVLWCSGCVAYLCLNSRAWWGVALSRAMSFWPIRVTFWSFAANCGLSFVTWHSDTPAMAASQMAKKMMERREKLAFGSLDAISKPMPNAANYVDVSNTASERPKCDTKTNAGNEVNAESIDNQSLVLSPVGPVPKLLGPHNQELCCDILQLWFACHLHVMSMSLCMSFACRGNVYSQHDPVKTDHEAYASRCQIIKIYQDVVIHDFMTFLSMWYPWALDRIRKSLTSTPLASKGYKSPLHVKMGRCQGEGLALAPQGTSGRFAWCGRQMFSRS